MRLSWSFALMLAGLLLGSRLGGATVYEVAQGRGDSSCSDIGTIRYGINNCARTAGDILDIRSGEYPEQLHGTVSPGAFFASGAPGNPITIRGHAGETVIINPFGSDETFDIMFVNNAQYVVFDNIIVDGANLAITGTTGKNLFKLGGSSNHITLQNSKSRNGYVGCSGSCCACGYANAVEMGNDDSQVLRNELYNVDAYGAYILGNRFLIDGNYVHDVQGFGIHQYDSAPPLDNNIIRNNYLRHNGWNNRNPVGD